MCNQSIPGLPASTGRPGVEAKWSWTFSGSLGNSQPDPSPQLWRHTVSHIHILVVSSYIKICSRVNPCSYRPACYSNNISIDNTETRYAKSLLSIYDRSSERYRHCPPFCRALAQLRCYFNSYGHRLIIYAIGEAKELGFISTE